jgi:hypothetical protein
MDQKRYVSMVKKRIRWTFVHQPRVMPTQLLRGRRLADARLAPIPLRMIAQIHRASQNGQMLHRHPRIVAMKFANLAPTPATARTGQSALHRDDELALFGDLRL